MPANQSTPEVTRASIRIALEDVTPTIAAAFGDDLCLIWSGEWQSYWRAGGNGYTKDVAQAGWYTIQAAYVRTRHCDPSKQIAFERPDATPARGGDELRYAAILASTDMAGAGEKVDGFRCHNCGNQYFGLPRAPDRCASCRCRDFAAFRASPPVEGLTSGEGSLDGLAARIYAILACEDDEHTPHVQAAMRGDPNARAGDLPMTARRIAMLAERHFASPKATATASVRECAQAVLARWDGSHDSTMVELMDALRATLTDSGTAATIGGER